MNTENVNLPEEEEELEEEAMLVTDKGLVTVDLGGGGGGSLGLCRGEDSAPKDQRSPSSGESAWFTAPGRPIRVSYMLRRVGTKSSAVVVPETNRQKLNYHRIL